MPSVDNLRLVEQAQGLPVWHMPVQSGRRAVVQCYREAGAAQDGAPQRHPVPLVLLHGIGAGSASWICQLAAAARTGGARLLAWDAPGYADSSALAPAQPAAQDYAQRLWDWLDALGIQQAHLVGHSLGSIMAASAARLQPARVAALTLLAPAQGYAHASPAQRSQMLGERLATLAELGVQQLAQLRGPALLSPQAAPEQVALAVHLLAQIQVAGYTQATHMLAGADIAADLLAFAQANRLAITIASGELDRSTSAKSCRALADQVGARYVSLGQVGHLCAVEASAAVNALLGFAEPAA